MPITSISFIRQLLTPFVSIPLTAAVAAVLRHRVFSFHVLPVAAAGRHRQNPSDVSRKPQQQKQPIKKLLKASGTVRQFSTFSPVLAAEERPQLSQNQAVGLVAASQANFMRVIVQSVPMDASEVSQLSQSEDSGGFVGGEKIGLELLCVVRAVLKKIRRRVLVGDKVVVGSIDWLDRRGMIENVFQRESEILDPPVSNVDHLLVLFSMDQPKLEPFTLTRFLVEAESTRIPLTLALNKLELVNEETLVSWKSRLHGWGYEPIFCSVESKHGLDTLQFILREQTSVIVGPSGVGKSSLINALRGNQHAASALKKKKKKRAYPVPKLPPLWGLGKGVSSHSLPLICREEDSNPRPQSQHAASALEGNNWFDPLILGSKWFEEQRVGEISARSGRGKHTTRHVSLLPLSEGGYLADTPGFNQPSLAKVTKQSLAQYFPEIQKMLKANEPKRCAFNDCLHIGEPGCLIKGEWERYGYYLQLLDEIKIREEFQLRTVGTKTEGDVRYKAGDMGVMQAEPRLVRKKHRRQSRKKLNQSILDGLDELDDEDNLLNEEDPILQARKNDKQ